MANLGLRPEGLRDPHEFLQVGANSGRERAYFLPRCSIAEADLVVDAPVEEMGFSPAPMNLAF